MSEGIFSSRGSKNCWIISNGHLDFAFGRIGLLAIKHDHVAYALHEDTVRAFSEFWCELLLLFLVRMQLHFDQFLVVQRLIKARKQRISKARLAKMNRRFESLTESAQMGNLFSAEFAHASIIALAMTVLQLF